jgi:VWFA-related protein
MQLAKWWLIATALLTADMMSAQTSSPPVPVETVPSQAPVSSINVSTSLVVLDVVVTDAKGNIVNGLKKQDFTILQDGKPQSIYTFETWKDRPPISEQQAVDRFGRPDWGETPLNIFVLDELNTPFDEKAYSAAMLKKYLKSQPAQLPGPSMLVVVNDYGYRALQDYTRDRDALIAKLDSRPPAIPSKLTRGANDVLLRQSFALLRQIALSADGLREHKNIIWIGRGFPALDPADLTDKSQASLQAAIQDTVTLLTAVRVTVFKVDPEATTTVLANTDPGASLAVGAGTGGDNADLMAPGEDPLATNFNFNSFVVATGGHYYYGLNDLNRFIDDSVQQGTEFYTLSYKPPAENKDGVFRNISIKMIPPGLTAQTRQGFYTSVAPKPEPTLDEMGFDLAQAAVSEMNYAGVSAIVTGVALSKTPGKVTVTLQIEDRTLLWKQMAAGGNTSDFMTVLVALDAKHQIVSSSAYKMHPLMAPADTALLTTGLLTVKSDVAVNSKVRYLRVLIRDENGRIGTADVNSEQLQTQIAKMTAQMMQHSNRR